MSITRIEKGSRMSQVAIHGETIYLAGQVGHGDSVAEQSREALAEVDRLLALSDSDKAHILSTTIWLATMDDFDEMNSVWDTWVDKDNPPVRACGEARLATPDYLVEFMVAAAKKAG